MNISMDRLKETGLLAQLEDSDAKLVPYRNIHIESNFDSAYSQYLSAKSRNADQIRQNYRAPKVQLDFWNYPPDQYQFNCYAAAVSCKFKTPISLGSFVPGFISLIRKSDSRESSYKKLVTAFKRIRTDLQRFADFTVYHAEEDGLIYTGHELNLTKKGYPMALFLYQDPRTAHSDFHWYAMKNDDQNNQCWVHKNGIKEYVKVKGDNIFMSVQNETKCAHFAGYFIRPARLY